MGRLGVRATTVHLAFKAAALLLCATDARASVLPPDPASIESGAGGYGPAMQTPHLAIPEAAAVQLFDRHEAPAAQKKIRLAADLAEPNDDSAKPVPVQYVKICSLYGAGFYYIPGTDMCVKIGGWVRTGHQFNFYCFGDSGIGYATPVYTAAPALSSGGESGMTWAVSGAIGINTPWGTSTKSSVSWDPSKIYLKYDATTALGLSWTPRIESLDNGYQINKQTTKPDTFSGTLKIERGFPSPETGGYITPRFAGFNYGTTYTPDITKSLNIKTDSVMGVYGKVNSLYGLDWSKYSGLTYSSTWTVPKTSLSLGLGYRFTQKEDTTSGSINNPYKPGLYDSNGLRAGDWLDSIWKIKNNPGLYRNYDPIISGSNNSWDPDRFSGLNLSLYDPFNDLVGPLLERSDRWKFYHAFYYGRDYKISYDGYSGEHTYEGYYGDDGNYHEVYNFYAYDCDDYDERIEYVYSGETGELIGYEDKAWDYDGIYTYSEDYGHFGETLTTKNYMPYLPMRYQLVSANGFSSIERTYPKLEVVVDRYIGYTTNNYLAAGLIGSYSNRYLTAKAIAPARRQIILSTGGIIGLYTGRVRPFPWIYDLYAAQGDGAIKLADGKPATKYTFQLDTPANPGIGSMIGQLKGNWGNLYSGYNTFFVKIPPPDARVSMQVEQAGPDADAIGAAKNRGNKGNGPAPVTKPPVVLKLFTNKPALPEQGKARDGDDLGSNQDPAECVADKSGHCTITVSGSDRGMYGLDGPTSYFSANIYAPYVTSIVWPEKSDAPMPTAEQLRQRMPSLPPQVRVRPREFSIGDKKFIQAMLETSVFNPSPERWKDYLQPADRPKRGDKGGGPNEQANASGGGSDDCFGILPAPYVEGQPLPDGGQGHALPQATVDLARDGGSPRP